MTASINRSLTETGIQPTPKSGIVSSARPSRWARQDSGAIKTFSLTRRIIAYVVTCQLLLTIGLSLVAVLYAREQLRGTFNTALDGDARGSPLMRWCATRKPSLTSLMFDANLLPPPWIGGA